LPGTILERHGGTLRLIHIFELGIPGDGYGCAIVIDEHHVRIVVLRVTGQGLNVQRVIGAFILGVIADSRTEYSTCDTC
jgi:hypothetical protein